LLIMLELFLFVKSKNSSRRSRLFFV